MAAQKGGLAAAARSDDAEDFLVADVERELAKRDHGAVEKQPAGVARGNRNVHAPHRQRPSGSPRANACAKPVGGPG